MSMPGKSSPPPPGSAGGKILLLSLVIVGVIGATCCCGGFVGLAFWLRSTPLAEQVLANMPGQQPVPAPNPPWRSDWVVNQVLARHYTEALDLVAESPAVIAALGEPIEPQEMGEDGQLFQRQNTGDLNPSFEAFQFPVAGPRGEGMVGVEALPFAGDGQYRLTKIIVTLGDGSVLEIPVPKKPVNAEAPEPPP